MPAFFDRLKVPVTTVLIALLAFFVFVKLFGPIPFAVNSVTTQKTDLFTVEGTGEATGIPDTAQVSIGVTKTAATVEQAQEQTNTAINKVKNELKTLGIEEKDIKTSNYSVNPNIDFTSGSQRTTGYTVSANLDIKIREAQKANQALDIATKNGANVVSGVSFILNDDEQKKLEEQARAEAIKNAKEKANSISKQVGIKLGRIINVYVTPNQGPIMYDKMSAIPAAEGRGGAPTELSPGENKVSVSVSISYETL